MLTLAELAQLLGGVWHGNAQHAICALSSLTRARRNHLAYFDNPLLSDALASTQAGAVLLKEDHLALCTVGAIVVSNPLESMIKAAAFFKTSETFSSSIHPSAQIHPSAHIGREVSVDAFSVIGEGVFLDDGVVIGSHVSVEPLVHIGAKTRIEHGAVIHANTLIGEQVVIQSGAIIGATPFNYLKEHGQWHQGLTLGGVSLADGVHIGANTVIDKGSVGDTYLSQGVRIDNLVQIAHDVVIGKNTAVAGCAVIGAHASVGADCIIGGASCIAASVQLVDDVVITGMSTVSKSINKSGIYSSGTLVHEHQRWRRNAARFRRLDEYITKLGVLERKVNAEH